MTFDLEKHFEFNNLKNNIKKELNDILDYQNAINRYKINFDNEGADYYWYKEFIDYAVELDAKNITQKITEQLTLKDTPEVYRRELLEELINHIHSKLTELIDIAEPIPHPYNEGFICQLQNKAQLEFHGILLSYGEIIYDFLYNKLDLDKIFYEEPKDNIFTPQDKEEPTLQKNDQFTLFQLVLLLRLLNKFNILNINNVKPEGQKKLLNKLFGNPTSSFTDFYSGKDNDLIIKNLIDEAYNKRTNTKRSLDAYKTLKEVTNEFKNDQLNKHINTTIEHLKKKLGT